MSPGRCHPQRTSARLSSVSPRVCCAAAMDQNTTESAVWATVEEGAVAPLSGEYLLRLVEGLKGSVVECLVSDFTLVGLSPWRLSLWSWATYKSGAEKLQRRQDLPPDAFRLSETEAVRKRTRLVALSSRWLSPGMRYAVVVSSKVVRRGLWVPSVLTLGPECRFLVSTRNTRSFWGPVVACSCCATRGQHRHVPSRMTNCSCGEPFSTSYRDHMVISSYRHITRTLFHAEQPRNKRSSRTGFAMER